MEFWAQNVAGRHIWGFRENWFWEVGKLFLSVLVSFHLCISRQKRAFPLCPFYNTALLARWNPFWILGHGTVYCNSNEDTMALLFPGCYTLFAFISIPTTFFAFVIAQIGVPRKSQPHLGSFSLRVRKVNIFPTNTWSALVAMLEDGNFCHKSCNICSFSKRSNNT